MDNTYYYFVWGDGIKENLIRAVESKKYSRVVIVGPEEHEVSKFFINDTDFLLLKRFFDYHNVELKIILGATKDKELNHRYPLINNSHVYPWDTFFANHVVRLNVEKRKDPLGHNRKISKHFISLNGRAHPWRCRFIDHMYKHDLFKYGYVSWHNSDNWSYNYEFRWWKPEILNFDKSWINNTDGILDIFTPPDEFKDSLFSIVSESNTNCLFITEKTYIPIFHKRPFLIYGAPNSHKYLKNLGFHMFDSIIDYSFDTINDDEERCDKFMKEVKKICMYDVNDLKEKLNPIIEHNFLNLLKLVSNKKIVSKEVRRLFSTSDQKNVHNYINALNIGRSPNFFDFLSRNKVNFKGLI